MPDIRARASEMSLSTMSQGRGQSERVGWSRIHVIVTSTSFCMSPVLQALLSFLTCSHFLRKHILTGLWLNRRMFSDHNAWFGNLADFCYAFVTMRTSCDRPQLHWGAASGRTTHSSVGNLRVSETDRQTKKLPNNLPFC
jgi:hypothetical protein